MRRAKKLNINTHSEFDLDLAPLLSVMVKLVPVLLLSSAFVQLMVIETELPQVVQKAVEEQKNTKNLPTVTIEASPGKILVLYTKDGQTETQEIAAKDGSVDLKKLHSVLIETKKKDPRVFKVELNPSEDLAYEVIVKIMDEARRARDPSVRFPIKDTKSGSESLTDYMYPEIVFSNTLEG